MSPPETFLFFPGKHSTLVALIARPTGTQESIEQNLASLYGDTEQEEIIYVGDILLPQEGGI